MNTAQDPVVVCFGEILWDVLPTGPKPGGAPMNVGYHLSKQGVHAIPITRVGDDKAGRELRHELERTWGLTQEYCQIDPKIETSRVEVTINEDRDVSYDIVFPVAWDFIVAEERHKALLAEADAFVFGCLAARHEVSRRTLHELLPHARLKVMDVNLRAPWYAKDTVAGLLEYTDILKINHDELAVMAGWFERVHAADERRRVQALMDAFNLKEVIVTRGKHGATYYDGRLESWHPGYIVPVADTVGAGDAFLAGFLSKRLRGESPRESMAQAGAVGAYVATQSGACPLYTEGDVQAYMSRFTLTHVPI